MNKHSIFKKIKSTKETNLFKNLYFKNFNQQLGFIKDFFLFFMFLIVL